MSFTTSSSRYVPHSETTRAHYERLLLDLRRCLPPGAHDELEDIAEEALAVVCTGASTGEAVEEQQRKLETLLDTSLSRDVRDRFLQYGKLITDYVVGQRGGGTANDEDGGAANGHGTYRTGVMDLDYEGPSSSTSEDEAESDELAMLRGVPRTSGKKPKSSLRADKDLVLYAYGDSAGLEGGENLESASPAGDDALRGEDSEGDGSEMDADAPTITFEEVASNPQYVKDALRHLCPALSIEVCEAQAQRVVEYLSQPTTDQFTLETQLTAFLGGYDDEAVMDWIGEVCSSRWSVVYGLRYAQSTTQKAKHAVMDAMREHAGSDRTVGRLYEAIAGREVDITAPRHTAGEALDMSSPEQAPQPPLRKVDLEACAFQDERTPHQFARATVPQGTQRVAYETHDEVILPPSATYNRADPLIPVTAFPSWAQPVFAGMTNLNPMQSAVYDCAFLSDENMLISAPTGAGKTNVAMMTMLRAVQNATSASTGAVDLEALKMVYIAPMKALVQEVVRTFSARLEPLGLTVAELSGDSTMTQRQMADTQLLVTTPEKWDIVTRKSVELGVAASLKLLIVDEVHLLHNTRGPVLEAIVARTMLQQQLRGEAGIRLVGLSATLPNCEDVASFLQVDRQRGLFAFNASYRPIPLQQSYCAIKKVPGMNHAAVMNRVAYDKVLQAALTNEQVMIFVHSRKETEYTANFLWRRAAEEHRSHLFVRPGSESERALQDAVSGGAEYVLRRGLQTLLTHGFAIHHAGLGREERAVVEQLFADRHIKVLVCTSTLAWGVNLPANHVIIKGTRVFNGAKAESELLSALDVLQMFGRAGRAGFGSSMGRAAIITTPDDLHYYLCVLNQQLPIESQMMRRVVDMLNAEITLGHVESIADGVRWLQRTYLYVRLRQAPETYGVHASAKDPLMHQHLANIVYTAVEELKGCKMAEYDALSRRIASTAYGRIASYCYVTAASMATYLAHLSNAMQDVDLFRVFAASSEFAHISVRAEEQAQLKDLLESAPIAVRESRYTPLAKINVLLQCYISRKNLEGLPLMSEMVYIKDSAQRILRALYEICLAREYGRSARQFLQLYVMVLHRQWGVQSPVRQVRSALSEKNFESILPTLERVRVSWEEVRQWSLEDLADKLSDDRRAAMALECIRHVPHYVLEASARPLTRGMLYVDVDITPDFAYSESVHGRSVCDVLLTVELPSGRLLHHEMVQLPLAYVQQQEPFSCPTIVVPAVAPRPTHLYVRCLSPSWLATEATAAVCLLNTRFPPVAPPLLEMSQRPPTETAEDGEVSALLAPYQLAAVGEQLFPFAEFSAMQRDLVAPILDMNGGSLLVCSPPGAGKTVLAELFVLQFVQQTALETAEAAAEGNQAATPTRKLLYLTSCDAVANRRYLDWRFRFEELLALHVVRADRTLPAAACVRQVAEASIVIATGEDLVSLVRRGGAVLAGVTHIVADHLHLLRAPEGRYVEECLARLGTTPYLVNHNARRARLLALSYPLISCAELGRWLKTPSTQQYNYGTSYGQLRVQVEALGLPGPRARYEAGVMAALKLLQRPSYSAVPSVLFVPHARAAEEVAKRVLLCCRTFVPEAMISDDVEDPRLGLLLAAGVAYLHQGTSQLDLLTTLGQLDHPVVHPTTQEALPLILVCAFDAAGRLPAALFTTAVVSVAERVTTVGEREASGDGDGTFADCAASELLLMTSRASSTAVVYCRPPRRWVWGQLLSNPLPLESSLRYPEDFRDAVNAAVAQRRAGSKVAVLRVLQTHYFLYHLRSNLGFYGVPSVEDIPLFASEFASRVVAGLEELGCVERPQSSARGAHGSATNEEGEAGGDHNEEDEDDPHAPLYPTTRGVALAHHCISVETMERLEVKMAEVGESGLTTVTSMWRVLVECCVELSAAALADVARVTSTAELRALHTIARALPSAFGVRYVDLDLHREHGKVFLLMLAHCARLFRSPTFVEASSPFELEHPLAHATTASAADREMLAAIPADIAAQLADHLQLLIPTAERVIAAAVELLDGQRRWVQVHLLMRLSQCVHCRTWSGEDALLQLPTVQDGLPSSLSPPGALLQAVPGLTLAQLQDAAASGAATPAPLLDVLRARLAESAGPKADPSYAESTLRALMAEAVLLPRIRRLVAHGTVEEMEGTLALAVDVTAEVTLASASPAQVRAESTSEQRAADEPLQWWVTCLVRTNAAAPNAATSAGGVRHTRLMSLRVEEQARGSPDGVASGDNAAASAEVPVVRDGLLSSRLFFPLSMIDGEDMDAIEMVASLTSVGFRVDAETTVRFGDSADSS